MAAVVAARWDIEWDRGGGWRIRLGRRTRSGDALLLDAPCLFEVREIDQPTAQDAALTLTGTPVEGGDYFDLQASREDIEDLPLRRYEHRVTAVDHGTALPIVLLRGYLTIRDTVGDD